MTHDETLTSDHPSTTDARPRRQWVGIAAAVAGAVAVGAVGYTFGQAADDPQAAAPVIALSGSSQIVTGDARPGSVVGSEPAPPSDQRLGVDAMPYSYGRIVFTSSGLSGDAGSTTAWTYDTGQAWSKETAARAATALGLDGEPTLIDGSWMVGSRDGTGPTLQVVADGMTSLNFYDPTMNPYGCGVAVAEGDGDSSSVSGSSGAGGSSDPGVAPDPACTPEAPNAPRAEDAIDRVKSLLTALGMDANGFEFETADYGTPNASSVMAYQVVDGQRSGAAWNVTLVGRQIQSAYGGLAPLVSLGAYGVVSPLTAVDRLSDPRYGFGFFGGPMPMGLEARAADGAVKAIGVGSAEPAAEGTVASQPLSPPPTVKPGSQFSWPVQEVTITKARLGLAMYTQTDGSTVLLPTYELSDADGQTWNVVAVDDGSLDF